MRLRNVKNKKEIIENSKYIVLNPENNIGIWNKVFGNENPIYIEIGMGKGKFILENALKNPNINYIGIEKYDSAIVRAIKRCENYDISNLKLIRMSADDLEKVFNKEIDLIYLTFSDPWPKDRHEKRRLTNTKYLNIYDSCFRNSKNILLRTDNKGLFEYSIISLSKYGYVINNIDLDLHKNSKCDIITTEYEDKFVSLGSPIYQVECTKR